MRFSPLTFILLALPLAEIASFVIVGREIGVLATIGLVFLSGFMGMFLLRQQGFGVMGRIRAEIEAGRDPGRELAHGLMILLAGILLLIPGFVTDIAGILLFIPPVREFAWRMIRRRVDFRTDFPMARAGFRRSRGAPTIDLDERDYSRTSNPTSSPSSPWRQIKED